MAAASIQSFSTTTTVNNKRKFPLVVVGGGSGGCATAAKFASKLGKDRVAVIEPAATHYYQPLWTLVGGGQKSLSQSGRPMGEVLPRNAVWVHDHVGSFEPARNSLTTAGGEEIEYEHLVVATGVQVRYEKIKGLLAALETPGVGSNYSPLHVEKTWKAIQDFDGGNCVFTFPNTPIKCPGAPQKIMYLAESLIRKSGRRPSANFEYFTSLPVLFGVKKYADALTEICAKRDINVNLRHNLIEVKPDTKEAVFENLEKPGETITIQYSLLHATPPMGPTDLMLKHIDTEESSLGFVDAAGYLDVDKHTLRHKKYKNVFGLGDCTNVPTSKTAAAVAGQLGHLRRNLSLAMEGAEATSRYDGYTSCPLVTGPGECILAEFDFQAPPQPLETFPVDQGKPRWTMYNLKAHAMPFVYWQMMLKGYWEGPGLFRKLMHLGMSR